MTQPTQLLLICGSVRAGSTNQALLDTAAALAPSAISTYRFPGLGLLPHFNPDDDHDPLPRAVDELRRSIAQAHALLFCTPEYAGSMPGALKNLLEWTVGGVEISDKPSGWVNTSTAPAGAGGAYAELAVVLRYTGARIVEAACVNVPVPRSEIGSDGIIADPDVRAAVSAVLETLVAAPPASP